VDVLALDSGNVYKNLALSPLGRSGDPILMLAIAGPKEGSPPRLDAPISTRRSAGP
jgi:hypothetical protein